jgi:hypothetical protein
VKLVKSEFGEFGEYEVNVVGDGEWITLMWNGQS